MSHHDISLIVRRHRWMAWPQRPSRLSMESSLGIAARTTQPSPMSSLRLVSFGSLYYIKKVDLAVHVGTGLDQQLGHTLVSVPTEPMALGVHTSSGSIEQQAWPQRWRWGVEAARRGWGVEAAKKKRGAGAFRGEWGYRRGAVASLWHATINGELPCSSRMSTCQPIDKLEFYHIESRLHHVLH